jgi:hypothetical protein
MRAGGEFQNALQVALGYAVSVVVWEDRPGRTREDALALFDAVLLVERSKLKADLNTVNREKREAAIASLRALFASEGVCLKD